MEDLSRALEEVINSTKDATNSNCKIIEGLYYRMFQALEVDDNDAFYKYLFMLNDLNQANKGIYGLGFGDIEDE